MGIQHVLYVNSGEGDTSYAKNSLIQMSIMYRTKPYVEEAIQELLSTTKPHNRLSVADLGCGSGPNSLLPMTMIMDAVDKTCEQLGCHSPEAQAFLNDLPGNDFNTVFKAVPVFYQKLQEEKDRPKTCFVSAVPGSFYGRLFPNESLQFVYSASSLHWLSQGIHGGERDSFTVTCVDIPLLGFGLKKSIPKPNDGYHINCGEKSPGVPHGLTGEKANLNKENICLRGSSPPIVFEAYKAQFRHDFTLFLKSRSEEIVASGSMVLTLKARTLPNPYDEERYEIWDSFADALRDMITKDIVKEEEVHSFNMPYYEPHIEELREIIRSQGSFDIMRLEPIPCIASNSATSNNYNMLNRNFLINSTRAITEPMLANHFGQERMDALFDTLKEKLVLNKNEAVVLVVSLVRKA